jgi:hypothetical protein
MVLNRACLTQSTIHIVLSSLDRHHVTHCFITLVVGNATLQIARLLGRHLLSSYQQLLLR